MKQTYLKRLIYLIIIVVIISVAYYISFELLTPKDPSNRILVYILLVVLGILVTVLLAGITSIVEDAINQFAEDVGEIPYLTRSFIRQTKLVIKFYLGL